MAKSAKKSFAFFLPLRLIFSLKNQGPELFKIMHLIGHEKCWQRLDHVFNWLKTYHG